MKSNDSQCASWFHSPFTFSLESSSGGADCGAVGPLATGDPWLRGAFSEEGIVTSKVGRIKWTISRLQQGFAFENVLIKICTKFNTAK